MIKRILCIVFLLESYSFSIALAQETKIIPVSPESSALAKYINFPVDYSTGIPNITIPLFDIKSGQIDLPITLTYHGGGIKVNEKSTWVGLGWNLNAEPEISRTINSFPDESSGYLEATYPYYDYRDDLAKEGLMTSLTLGRQDRDPDEFYYHLSESSGKFYLENSTPDTFKAIPVPYAPIKIRMFKDVYNTITDVDGTYYRFGSSDFSSAEEKSLDANAITTWKCSEMISPSKKDTVLFAYSPQVQINDVDFNEKIEVYDNFSEGNMTSLSLGYFAFGFAPQLLNSAYNPLVAFHYGTPRVTNYSTGTDNGYYYYVNNNPNNHGTPSIYINPRNQPITTITQPQNKTIKISTIQYRQGTVKFFQHFHLVNSISISTNELDSIQVSDYSGKVIRSIQFFLNNCVNSPVVGTADYLTHLDSIWIKDGIGKLVERYAFDYNQGYGLQYGQNKSDPWGYYNGDFSNYRALPNAVPSQIVATFNNDYIYNPNNNTASLSRDTTLFPIGNTRQGVTNASQAWVLKKIHYPTGGRAEFTFEPNQSTNGLAGGLRIANIKYFTDNGPAIAMEKHYRYGRNENGVGFIKTPDYLSNYTLDQTIFYLQPLIQGIAYTVPGSGEILMPSTSYVTEHKRTFFSHPMRQMSFSNGSPVVYDVVTEYRIDNGVQTGKTIYKYNYNGTVTDYQPLIGNISQQFDEWPWGQLLSATNYAYVNGQYVWIKKHTTNYISRFQPTNINIVKAFNYQVYAGSFPIGLTPEYYDTHFTLYPYALTSGNMLPSLETDSARDINDTTKTIAENTNYYYDNPNSIYATRIASTDGTGNIRTNYVTHPADYPATDPFIGPLINANMLDLVIEQVTTLKKPGITNPLIINGSINKYATDGTAYKLNEQQIEPSSYVDLTNFKFSNVPKAALPQGTNIGLYPFSADPTYRVKRSYDVYDERGNIEQITDDSTRVTSYIWDYNKLYPIAEVKNARLSQVAYSSFEGNATGNWSYVPANITSADARTGRNSLSLSSVNPLSKSGLTSTQTYLVSYWSKNLTPYNIAGSVGTPAYIEKIKSKNGTDYWYYYVHQVTGENTITVSGTGYIDDVRLYPADAQMTTYTYDPLKGLTSSTDTKNETTFFSYDAYGRLILIKDQQGNILKQFKYHYNYE